MSEIKYEFKSIGASGVERDMLMVAAAREKLNRSNGGQRRSGSSRRSEYSAETSAAKQSAIEFKKAEQEKTRIQRNEGKHRWRELQGGLRRAEREEKRSIATRHKELNKGYALAAKNYEKEERALARRKAKASQSRIDRLDGLAKGLIFGGASAAIGAAAAIGVPAYRQFEANDLRSRALAISGGNRDLHRTLLNEATGTTQRVRGATVEDVLSGQQKYTAMTGDLAGARRFKDSFAITAAATGSRNEDIAATAATLQQKFGIKNEAEMQKALASITAQGKAGAFEMSDAAQYMQEMGAAGSRFGLDKGAGGVAKLGALSQFAMQSTGSGAEAATAVRSMFADLVQNSGAIKQMNRGRETVFADKGHTRTRDIQDVLVDTIAASKGDLKKLDKVFGERGIKAVSSMVTEFNRAANELPKTATEQEKLAAGTKAVRAMFGDMANVTGDWKDVVADASTATDTASNRLTQAWEKLSTDIGQSLEPGLKDLADAAVKCAPLLASMAKEVGSTISGLAAFAKLVGVNVGAGPAKPELPGGVQYQMNVQERDALAAKKKKSGLSKSDMDRFNELNKDISSYEDAAPTHLAPVEPSYTDKQGRLVRSGTSSLNGGKSTANIAVEDMSPEERAYWGKDVSQYTDTAKSMAAFAGQEMRMDKVADPTKLDYGMKGGVLNNQVEGLMNWAKSAATAGDKQDQAANKMLQASEKMGGGRGTLLGGLGIGG